MIGMNYKIVDINPKNVTEYGLFCLKSRFKEEGYKNKIKWFTERYKEGLRVKLLLIYEGEKRGYRSRGFIEYVPVEYAWRGIEAKGWMVIHCIWVVEKNKKQGLGSELLKECLKDAKDMNGVAVVTSRKNWLPKESLFIKHGFEKVDEISDCELYVKKFSDKVTLPRFSSISPAKVNSYRVGLTILKSDQCPYAYNIINIIKKIAERRNVQLTIKHISSCKDAQKNGVHPYGTFCVLYQGKAISYYPGVVEEIKEVLKGY